MHHLFNCLIFICALSISFANMTGGWDNISNDNPDAQEHAKYAAAKISASMNNLYHYKLTNISNTKRQVVAGYNYNMNILLSPTECKKNKHNMTEDEINECPILECKSPISCNVTLWVRVWIEGEEGRKMTKSTCEPLPLDSSCNAVSDAS